MTTEAVQVYEGDGKPCYIPGDIELLGQHLRRFALEVSRIVADNDEIWAPLNRIVDPLPVYQADDKYPMPEKMRTSRDMACAKAWELEHLSQFTDQGSLSRGHCSRISFILGNISGNILDLGGPVNLTFLNEIMTLINRINDTCPA